MRRENGRVAARARHPSEVEGSRCATWKSASYGRRALGRSEKDGDREWSPYNSGELTGCSPSCPPIAPSGKWGHASNRERDRSLPKYRIDTLLPRQIRH